MTARLLLSYLALTVVVLAALEIPLGVVNAHNERQDITSKVERDAVAMGSISEDALEHGRTTDAVLRSVVARYQSDTGGRVVIVNARGYALADSAPLTPTETYFGTRPEIRTALGGHVATGTRYSETLHANLLYVAVPVASSGKVLGAVRITYPTSTIDERIAHYWLALALVAAVVLAAAALVGWLLSRSLALPLRRLEKAAERVGEGELHARAPEDVGPEEIRRLARTLNETTAKLEVLVKSQQDFVADASHQLRTPLTALRLRLENLERDVAPAGRDSLAAAVAEAERLTRLVSELLALARTQEDVEPAAVVDLAELAASRADAWSAFAGEREVAIRTRGTPVRARAGAGRLEQVLDNLLANALEVSPRGGTIDVSTVRRDGWVELHVVDEGPGLSAGERERAFDRFWRAGGGDGSGLGLAIARRLVEVDEGEIELRAAETGGVDAVVRLRPS